MKDDKSMLILAMYVDSIFQVFGSSLRTEVDLVEDDCKLVLVEYNSGFITYDLTPVIYTFRDISEALSRFLQSEYGGYHNAVDIEFDDITGRRKMFVRSVIIAIKFDEIYFLVPSSVSNMVGIVNTIMNTLVRKL